MMKPAADPNHEYVTINIDLRSMKELSFDDVVRINTPKEYEDWLVILNSYLKKSAKVERVYNYDFNFLKRACSFALTLTNLEAIPKACKSLIPKTILQPFIKDAYLNL